MGAQVNEGDELKLDLYSAEAARKTSGFAGIQLRIQSATHTHTVVFRAHNGSTLLCSGSSSLVTRAAIAHTESLPEAADNLKSNNHNINLILSSALIV